MERSILARPAPSLGPVNQFRSGALRAGARTTVEKVNGASMSIARSLATLTFAVILAPILIAQPTFARPGGGGLHAAPAIGGSSRTLAAGRAGVVNPMNRGSPSPPTHPTGPTSSSTQSGTVLTTTPPAPPPAPSTSTGGPATLQPPAAQAPAIAPLSPQLSTQISGGGVPAQSNLALSPGSSASPSESAPSAPGGGGKSLADCMGFWDKATHMSKTEWRAACQRTMQEYPTVQ